MTETTEVISIRIESLEHTRQLVAILAGSLTAVYAVIGVFSANQTSWSLSNQAWNVLLLMLLITLGLTNLCFVQALLLLTDSIHNYSKILEYLQSGLYTSAESNATLAHKRALASDDFGYFFVRVGTFSITYNLLLALTAVIFKILCIPQLLFYVVLVIVLLFLIAFFLVAYCYYVSHYTGPEYSFGKAIARFWNYKRWRDAAIYTNMPTKITKKKKQ